ncbi:oxidoreductase [Actinorhabdospora filicis]|uniref:Oxidoreductase n=1 Tax=Actinorhabdospora filicis TaxID=1785913 RepID=A0A9W6SGB7_9ACTN|nr:NAD(P)/FAD-dependent oxidoreductase [Actinorhabdospora filicis]GLZ75495.1 oxidoreductase [Actinorhabdospora filicis]
MNASSLHVLVVGGGIGGLALAQGLRKSGVSVAVYERDLHRDDRLQGYRIHINPQGSRALHELLPPESFAAFTATAGHGGNEFRFYDEKMRELLHLDEAITTGGARSPEDGHHGVSRITLRQVLLAGLDGHVRYGKRFERYERTPDGRVTAFFEDGTSATGDVLVGADGGNSRVRRQYLPHAQRVQTGVVTIVGKYALTPEARRALPAEFLRGPASVMPPRDHGMFIAPHEFAPAAAGAIGSDDPALAPGALFDNTTPYVFWAFAAKREAYRAGRALEDLDGAGLHDLARAMTASWSPRLRALVEGTDTSTVTLIPITTSVPVDAWAATNVTLLGDAIHSMTPFRGIGANTALRDARHLHDALVAVARGERPVVPAIGGYEERMRDYGFAAVRASLKTAMMTVSGNPVGRFFGKTAFRAFNAMPAVKRKVFAGFGDA